MEEKKIEAHQPHRDHELSGEEETHEGDHQRDSHVIRNEEEYFSEWHLVKEFLEAIIDSLRWKETWEQKWEAISTCLLIFQEQPTLLSPHLEDIVIPLTNSLINLLQQPEETKKFQRMENSQFHVICKVLQLFCRIRGYKHVIKYFPHEVWHIELCMSALRAQDKADHNNWETRYIMLLWLCMLCLIPFDICSMDSTMSLQTTTFDDSNSRHEHQSKLVYDMIGICKDHLSESGPTREAGYACLSALFTRPDMEASILSDFMTWSCGRLTAWAEKGSSAELELNKESFQLIGLLHCLSQIFKKGHRNNLLPYASQILQPCLLISNQPNQTLVRKLLAKVFQRIALTFLPPREAAWRYQRGSRSLLQNLQHSLGKVDVVVSSATSASTSNEPEIKTEEEEEDVDIPAEMEEIVEKLLNSLRDKDTVVRWSAAKGIGRITMRLPLGFGDDVVGAVIGVFDDLEADSAWHGGCLALAELSRRGLLLPARLEVVIPIVVNAMHFDLVRGQHSVGAHVRDAACYVCWAFARAYAPNVMRPYISSFTEAMILAALFDREINCRRAASAAFQENVGRQGNENFPHGIEIISIADYFSLGNKTSAYLTIAPQIAKMSPQFLEFMVKHLSKVKLGHWDVEIRSLAAKSLGELTKLDPILSVSNLREILVHCMSPIPNLRHGSILAVGEVIQSQVFHHSSSHPLSSDVNPSTAPAPSNAADIVTEISELVLNLNKGRMFRNKGGDLVREAACLLIQHIAMVYLPMSNDTQVNLVMFLNENLRQPHEHIQIAAAAGLRQMLFSYIPVPSSAASGSGGSGGGGSLQSLTVMKYMKGLKTEENVAITRGYALALGALPYRLISRPAGRVREVFQCLSDASDPLKQADIETRRNAINSLVELTEKIIPQIRSSILFQGLNDEATEGVKTPPYTVQDVINVLLRACNDYSVDKRGDTGSWCRIAGLKGLERIVFVCFRHLNNAYPRTVTGKFSSILPPNSLPTTTPAATTTTTTTTTMNTLLCPGAHVITSYGHAVIDSIVTHHSETNAPLVVSVSYPRDNSALFGTPCGQLFLTKGLILIGYSFDVISQHSPHVFKVTNFQERRTSLLNSLDCSSISSITIQEAANFQQLARSNPNPTNPPTMIPISSIDESLMKVIMGVILKLLGEKLDAVREVAADVLESFLQSQDPVLDLIPDKTIILGCLSSIQKRMLDSHVKAPVKLNNAPDLIQTYGRWTQSKYVYTFLTGVLDSSHYFKSVLSGMIISIGALSEGIAKDSFNALLHWCRVQLSIRNLRDISLLGSNLLEIFQENAKLSRITLPTLKTFHYLLKNDLFNPILTSQSATSSFSATFGLDLLKCIENELSKCTEMAKIRAGVDLYLFLLMFDEPVRSTTWRTLLALVGHKYPKIRKYVAELLYVQLISDSFAVGPSAEEVKASQERDQLLDQKEAEKGKRYLSGLAPTQEALERAMEILTTTVWDEENLPMAREKRAILCNVLGISVGIKTKSESKESHLKSNEVKVDELDSYDSLVREAGY